MDEQVAEQPRFGRWIGAIWLYTVLRFGLFFALWGVLYLVGLHGFFAPVAALILSVPLSIVLLAKPRAALAHQLELRVEARRAQREALHRQLDPDFNPDPDA